MYEKWKALWVRLFGRSYGWTRRDKVLEYVLHRIGERARLQEVVQEEYARRIATRHEIEVEKRRGRKVYRRCTS